MSCKALGLAIKDSINGKNDFGMSLPYILVLISVVFIAIQMNYLNKALDLFNTSVVTPIYYVLFTSLVIIASAILFKEWKNMSFTDIVGDLCGFLVVICAVFLLNAFKEMEVSLDDLTSQMRPRRRLVSVAPNNNRNHSQINMEEAGGLMQRYDSDS
jgi:multidrug transporter EmrE-like cation transporter